MTKAQLYEAVTESEWARENDIDEDEFIGLEKDDLQLLYDRHVAS